MAESGVGAENRGAHDEYRLPVLPRRRQVTRRDTSSCGPVSGLPGDYDVGGSPSHAAEMVWPSCTGYAAARFALRGLHEALSQDLAGTGVRSCQVIFGEVSSDYWENNPGSRAYVPKISKTVPVMTPEACARVLLRVAERPRRQVVYPFMLRLYHWNYALAPWLVRWLLRLTGRKRSRP